MNKLSAFLVAPACVVSAAFAEVPAEDPVEVEKEESSVFEAGFDFEFFSAYSWRNSILNDRSVVQPSVWGEFTHFEPFWLGFWIWQNYDLTDRRRECLRNSMSETDYNVHAGTTLWSSDDESMSLDLEVGHEWYANMGVQREYTADYCDVREIYAKATFNNELANVYGQVSWLYDKFGPYRSGFYYELGLNREFDVLSPLELPEDTLFLGVDWNLSFGDKYYLSYLYGGTAEGGYPNAGIGGTTVKTYLSWKIADFVSLVGTLAYTGVLNSSVRDALDELGPDVGWEGDRYPRDLLWWGISLKFAF